MSRPTGRRQGPFDTLILIAAVEKRERGATRRGRAALVV
jgi:hypothetical protein